MERKCPGDLKQLKGGRGGEASVGAGGGATVRIDGENPGLGSTGGDIGDKRPRRGDDVEESETAKKARLEKEETQREKDALSDARNKLEKGHGQWMPCEHFLVVMAGLLSKTWVKQGQMQWGTMEAKMQKMAVQLNATFRACNDFDSYTYRTADSMKDLFKKEQWKAGKGGSKEWWVTTYKRLKQEKAVIEEHLNTLLESECKDIINIL